MKMSLKDGEAYAALREQVTTQIQEMKVPWSVELFHAVRTMLRMPATRCRRSA